MASWLITWSLRNRYLVIGLSLVIALLGGISLARLNFDAFPDTTPVQVQINTTATGLVPEEIERMITFPIELALGGMRGLEGMRSVSQFGLSQVVVTFKDGTDIYFARQLVNERLGQVQMPDGIERPQMGPVSTGLGEVFHYLVTSKTRDLTDVRTIHDWTIKPAMRPVPGTAEINSWGGMEKQYQVRIDPARLIRHDVTFDQVVQAVRNNNLNVGGGNINRNQTGEMLLVHGIGRTINVEQIDNIVIAAVDGVPIRVRDVADVTIGHEIRRGAVTANGQGEVVLGLGFMLMGENSYAVTRRLKEKMDDVRAGAPEGIEIDTVYDRTELVDHVIDTVRKNLFDGALLVIAIIFIFLGNLRAGLIVAIAIPISMLFAFSGMLRFGIAGTLLSLGAIDFGIVVDSSVVVVENVVRHIAHGSGHDSRSRVELVRDAAIEVRQPTIIGQLIIMIVYLPILTLEGVEGKMFRPMAITVILVLVGSLILSLTLMPVLASLFLPKQMSETDPLLVRIAKRIYSPLLQLVLKARYAVLAVAAVVLAVTLGIAARMGSEFVPRLSEGAVVIGVVRAAGTDLEESIRMNTQIEKVLLQNFPDEIQSVWSRAGAPEVATDPGGVESTDIFIALTTRDHWTKATNQTALVELMEETIQDIPGQTTWFTQPIEQRINEMISGVRSDVAIKLFGDEFETLLEKAGEIEAALKTVSGAADVATEQISGQPVLQVRVDQDQIARYGVPASTVLELVESIGSKPLGQIVEGQLRFPIAVRLPEHLRSNPDAIAGILLATPTGERLPLSRLASVETVLGPRMISRELGKRRITVQCNVRGRDVGSFVAEAQEKIGAAVELPNQYWIEWGGQFENMQRARKRLMIVVPLALSMIAGILYLSYRNVIDTTFLFLSVPFACVGGIIGLWWREMPLSISSAVGFITLSGVSVLNSMVLVTAIRDLQKSGYSNRDAIVESCITRLRTVMMTALVASVGFAPMALSDGVGAEVQRPLATVVIGGVISSTLMTLIVLPVLYYLFGAPRKAKAGGAQVEPDAVAVYSA
ncbi:MAG: efflux RND transporter permease subunit [Planctomycetaceae bacterium]|nr:efflux RND transporter permease subunit [Planctomycetaceae bacterium]